MSRCFPFPPPGYEKKTRTDETDLLTKEKHNEKKHKKDKKDKEKREGKEKKDKERSKEKHKEKKERKEKHKDRKDKAKGKEKNQTLDDKKVEVLPAYRNGEKLAPNILENNGIGDFKYVQELARRIRDEDAATGSHIVEKIKVTDQRRAELPGRMVESNIGNPSEKKEKPRDKKDDERKINGQRNDAVARSMEDVVVKKFSGMDQKRVEAIARPMEKNDVGKQMEGKESYKHKESDKKGEKPKDKDRKKKSKSKEHKEKKKEEKTKEITEPRKELPKLKEDGATLMESGKESLDVCNAKPPDLLKTSSKSSAEGNLGKRKALEINGFLHDNVIRPHKLLRPVSSSHPVMENGRKLEPCQIAIQFDSEWQGAENNFKVGIKEHGINGLVEAQHPNVCSTRPLPTTVQVNENGEASGKPPHPDSKHLNQILSVPKVEQVPDFDDQEWLFGSNYVQSKKPKVDSAGVDGIQQLWDQAIWLENADVTALPYVIPY